MHLKIASRSSDLARWQAVKVGETLKKKNPDLTVEYIFKSSFGDQNLDLPLAQMESKGVFTQDFYQDLKAGNYDLVVHSWKDLPTEEREGTMIAATLERADVRDILLIPKDVWAQALQTGTLKLLTSSPRRIYNLEKALPRLLPQFKGQIEYIPVRGNIPSRLDKMFAQGAGLVMAKAAFDRMLSGGTEEFEEVRKRTQEKVDRCHFMVLPLELNPNAPAQGALAIEIARHREDLKKLLASVNDEVTFRNVEIERDILRAHGGGCHQKIGVAHLTKPYGVYHIEKGESEWGIALERIELLQNHNPVNFKGETSQSVFPLKAEDNLWFDRRTLLVDPAVFSKKSVFVARVTGKIEGLEQASQIWASGVRTWEKLAQQGFWVNGCFESLGESESEWIGPVNHGLQWVKLSHEGSEIATSSSKMTLIPSYELHARRKEDSANLEGKKFFYWMSVTSFERALELYPEEVTEGFHACGAGLTFETLKANKNLKNPPVVFLNLNEFHEFLKRNGVRFN